MKKSTAGAAVGRLLLFDYNYNIMKKIEKNCNKCADFGINIQNKGKEMKKCSQWMRYIRNMP